jgi:peptidase M23-like protein
MSKLFLHSIIIFSLFCAGECISQNQFFLPVAYENRQDVNEIELTEIGDFGRIRKARPGIPSHFHTGIDIKRPSDNYEDEPIFPIAKGKVISMRNDGPYAQIIIEHKYSGQPIWSVYEHVAEIQVNAGDEVSPFSPIARFMNKEELNKYGWQFDHFHLEIFKMAPIPREPTLEQQQLFFKTFGLICYTEEELMERYFHPLEFLKQQFSNF